MPRRVPPELGAGLGEAVRRTLVVGDLRWAVDSSMVEKALTTTGPVRTCIGCRQRAAIAELVRVAAAAEHGATVATIDRTSTMPGRGAWLHHDPDCLRAAMRRRAFGPALRVPGLVVDAEVLEREMSGGHPPGA